MGYGNAGLQQTVEVLLRTGGTSDADALRDAMVKLNAQMTATAQASRALGTPISDMLKELAPLAAGYRQVKVALAELEKQEAATARATEEAAGKILRAKIDAYARAERAAEQAAETEKRLAGEAMRARIDGYAREERAAEQSAEAKKRLDGEAMRARIDGYARAERAAQQTAEAQKQADGEAMRARIEGYARAERAAEQAVANQRKLDGDALRSRIDTLARQERAAEQAAEAQKQADGQAMRARIEHYARTERAAEAAAESDKRTSGEAMRARIDAMARAERSTDQWAASMRRLKPELDLGAQAAKAQAQTLMQVSWAAQDLSQNGFAAIVNNVPGLTRAFNIGMEAAGGLMLGAVALDVVFRNLGPTIETACQGFAESFGLVTDPTQTLATNVDQLKAKLEAMTSKTYKVELDYLMIEATERMLKDLQDRLKAYEGAKESDPTRRMGRDAAEAITVYSGGSEKLKNTVLAMDKEAGVSHGTREQIDMVATMKHDVDRLEHAQPTSLEEATQNASQLAELKKGIAALENEIKKANEQFAELEVGGMIKGDPDAIRRMQDRAKKAPERFSQVGPGGVTSAEAIAALASSPEEALSRVDLDLNITDADEKDKVNEAAYTHGKKTRKDRLKREDDFLKKRQQDETDGNTAEGREHKARLAREARRTEADLDQEDRNAAAEAAQGKHEQRVMTDVERKRHALAAHLAKGGLGERVEVAILQNKLMLDQGNPNAVAPGVLADHLRNKVGFDLAQGGKDPSLANEIVGQARNHVQDKIVLESSRTARTMDGVADNQSMMLHLIEETMARVNHVEMQNHQNRAHMRRLQTRGPTGLKHG